ncbi:MAG: GYD domain-containing protein, partial [Endomicrobiia bacterium]
KFNGEVKSMFALLGEHDLVLIVDFPDIKSAMKASISLTKLTGISFSTLPAVTVEQFDKMVSDL